MPASLLLTLVCLIAPVDAPVTDPFRPPPCPWCPGNRGLELDTDPGEAVVAPAFGRITFAGEVAGALYVTIGTPDGLLVTVGRLVGIDVRAGQQVWAGQIVAAAGDTTILTVRRDGEYVDPAPLIGVPSWRPRLVPLDGAAPRPPRPGPLRCPARTPAVE